MYGLLHEELTQYLKKLEEKRDLIETNTVIINQEIRSIRLRIAKIKGTHTTKQWVSLLLVCNHKCVKCASSSNKIHKDHILPICRGGSDSIHNIQPLCSKCNCSKSLNDTDYRPEGWSEVVLGYHSYPQRETFKHAEKVNLRKLLEKSRKDFEEEFKAKNV